MESELTGPMVVALTTCPPDKAAGLAEALVEARVAACVNILPTAQSVYRWDGKVVQDGEALLVIKTTPARVEALQAAVLQHHSYEVPEFVVLAVESGHAPYIDWVVKSVS